jgi:hypothetical protein
VTDYTDLIARLRSDEAVRINWDDHINGRLEHRKPTARELEAADALEAQARRIAELEDANVSLANLNEGLMKMLMIRDARIAELEAALSDTTAHLVAAVSLLERGGKKAAPSNTMFEQMLVDHKNSIERARAALEKKND